MLPWLRTRCRRRRRWCQCLGILILVHHHRLHERARKCRQNFGCLGLKLCLFFDLRTSPYEYYRYARIEIQIKIRNTTLTIAATSFLLGVSSLYTMILHCGHPCGYPKIQVKLGFKVRYSLQHMRNPRQTPPQHHRELVNIHT